MPREKNIESGDYRFSRTLFNFVKNNPHKFLEYEFDPDHGHWVYLTDAYIREGYGSRTIRTDTVKEMFERMRREVVEVGVD